MGLTAIKLELLVASLAVAGLVTTVWWIWPRLSARTIPSILGRVGVLLLNQILTLATLGLALNNYFGFYGSWADLLGTDTPQSAPIVADQGAGVPPPAEVTSGVQVISTTRVPLISGRNGDAGGRLQQVVISGATSRLSSPAYVYLPPQYFEERYADTRFPVIVALTGYPGDARNLVTRMNMPIVAAKAIDRREMMPAIMVLMRPTVAPPRDTECVDVPEGPQVETYFTKDLREAMASGFRVGTDAANWGILGASTGGYCALKVAMRHPEAYSAAVSLSGYLKPPIDATTGDLFGGSRKLRNENDMMWRLAHLPHPPISVLVTSSRQGESNYQSTLAFLQAVKPPMQASSLILPSGGHNFNTWSREVPQALPWLVQQLHMPAHASLASPTPSPRS
ncbi:alpha/beta hydrolase-fold protein [Sphaerisporangium sp. NPDC051017]|uniref:alpha/beta hydrolase n=1 Tax=Sphaerisporangium sp. NPDC051017 TaxID=3154636 RepID=UPI003431D84A